MKSRMKPAACMGFALCLINSARTDNSQYQAFRNNDRRFNELFRIIWNADTLKKISVDPNYSNEINSNKSLYELMLPHSILHTNTERPDTLKIWFPEEIESEMLGLQNSAWKEYDKYTGPKTNEYALKAIAYLQYQAIKYPGTDGSELERAVRMINSISKELRRDNK